MRIGTTARQNPHGFLELSWDTCSHLQPLEWPQVPSSFRAENPCRANGSFAALTKFPGLLRRVEGVAGDVAEPRFQRTSCLSFVLKTSAA